MKIKVVEQAFKPLTVNIESQKEALAIRCLIGGLSVKEMQQAVNNCNKDEIITGREVSDLLDSLYEACRAATEENE